MSDEQCGVCYRRLTLELCGCGCERLVCGRCYRSKQGMHPETVKPGDIPMDRLRPPVNPGPIIPAKQGMHPRSTT